MKESHRLSSGRQAQMNFLIKSSVSSTDQKRCAKLNCTLYYILKKKMKLRVSSGPNLLTLVTDFMKLSS